MEMRREAHHLVEEFKSKRKHALLNLLSDSVAGTAFFVTLAAAREARCVSSVLACAAAQPGLRQAVPLAHPSPVPTVKLVDCEAMPADTATAGRAAAQV